MAAGQTPRLSSCFDSGNGVLEAYDAAAHEMRVSIRPDPYTEVDGRAHMQWFHFKGALREPPALDCRRQRRRRAAAVQCTVAHMRARVRTR